MALPSGESLLISALLNVGNVGEATHYGITPEHFLGYRDEYNWLQNYVAAYAEQPSVDAFRAQFPGFSHSEHADVRWAVDKVYAANGKHRLQEAMNACADLMAAGDVHAAYARLVEAEPQRTSAKPKRLLTDLSFLDHWDDDHGGVAVPYRQLQHFTGGIKPGNLWYLAARPGQGKTAHLCNIATRAVLDGNRVIFYSLEMSEMEVRARFHAALASHFKIKNITMSGIRDRSIDKSEYKEFIQFLDEDGRIPGQLDIHTPKDGVVTPATVATRAADYHLSIIDYVTLMRSDNGSSAVEDWRTAAMISNRLKEIALSEGAAICAASQINREGDVGNHPPKLKNLAQSDALGQDGDVVITMRAMENNVATFFSLEKNRHGRSQIPFYTTFDPNHGVYANIDKERAENLILEQEL